MTIKLPVTHIWRPELAVEDYLAQAQTRHDLVMEVFLNTHKQVIKSMITRSSFLDVSFPTPDEVVLTGSKKAFQALAKHLYRIMCETLGVFYGVDWEEYAELVGWTSLESFIENMIGWLSRFGFECPQKQFERLLSYRQ